MIRRFGVNVVLVAVAVLGCGGAGARGPDGSDRAAPAGSRDQASSQQAYYRRLGRFAAESPIPFVGTVAFAAEQGDTTAAIVGLSLANDALSFRREPGAFAARYHVDIQFQPESGAAIDGGQDEVVRVPTFQETRRSDESILFQKVFRLLPGAYRVTVRVRDAATPGESEAGATVAVPRFDSGTTSAPIPAYQATGRTRPGEPLSILLNPRGAVGYGGDTLLVYVEGYRFAEPTRVPLEVRTEQDSIIFQDSLSFHGGQPIESQIVRLRPDSLALGTLRVVVGSGEARRSTSVLVSLSQSWVVTNFDEMLSLLRYFGDDGQLAEMRHAPPGERAARWREFWAKSDPDPTTPENEALDQYLTRLAAANSRFGDEGTEGWRTERGEVYIGLGEPDNVEDAGLASQGRVIRWTYAAYRLALFFVDDTGFGRFRLTPVSRAEFERVADRVRRQGGG